MDSVASSSLICPERVFDSVTVYTFIKSEFETKMYLGTVKHPKVATSVCRTLSVSVSQLPNSQLLTRFVNRSPVYLTPSST